MHHFKKILLVLIILSLGISLKLWVDFKNHPPEHDLKKDAQIQIAEISNALHAFYNDCKRYPTTEEGLKSLVEKPLNCDQWGPKPYLKAVQLDPWGHAVEYHIDSPTHFIVMSLGSDGRQGGVGQEMDISSDEK